VGLTISILITADLIGLTPSPDKSIIDARKKFVESMAVQFSLAAMRNEPQMMDIVLRAVVGRNSEVVTAAVRRSDGVILAKLREHEREWVNRSDGKSTPTHVQLPIFKGSRPFGKLEIVFSPIKVSTLFGLPLGSLGSLAVFVALVGFCAYWLIIRRSLNYLDPSSAIPSRVNTALNVLTEGVVVLDEKGRVVLANSSFTDKTKSSLRHLLGGKLASFQWLRPQSDEAIEELPWESAIENGESKAAFPMALKGPGSSEIVFMVNCAPIIDGAKKVKGAMVSFDDVTQLEAKNVALRGMLSELSKSRDMVAKQNEELHILATRDGLTGLYNRRAFFEEFQELFSQAQASNKNLCCVMADIDHFKSVNDDHGHATGDEVIKVFSSVMMGAVRSGDMVGRYGGEEFCILLPELEISRAMDIAERCRQVMEDKTCSGKVKVTGSFGVSCLDLGASTPEELINEADQALYYSKEHGRNRVTSWQKILGKPELKAVPIEE